MATNSVQVIEKNVGDKIQWEQDGYRLSFDDDALSVKVSRYQDDDARVLDICRDRSGDLMIGVQPGGRYVAQIEIPAASYIDVHAEDGDEQTMTREQIPLDMADVKLILWSVE